MLSPSFSSDSFFNKVYSFQDSWMNPCDSLPFDSLDMFFPLWNRCASPSLLNSTSVKNDSVCVLYFYEDQSSFLVCFYNLGSWTFQGINSEFWLPLCRLSYLVTCLKHYKDFLFFSLPSFLPFFHYFFPFDYFILLFYVYRSFVCMYAWATHLCNTLRRHKRASEPLGLDLHIIVSHHICAENQPRPSGTAVSTLKNWDIASVPQRLFFFFCNGSLIISLIFQGFFFFFESL